MNANRIRKFLKVALALAVCLVIPLGLSACANEEQAIKSTLSQEFDALKDPTNENLKKYLGDDIDSDANFQQLSDYGIDPYDFLGHLFKHFDYKIGEVKVDGNTATVQVTLTNVDVAKIVKGASDEYMSSKSQEELLDLYAQGGENAIMQDVFKAVYEKLDSATDTKSTDVTLKLTKSDNEWSLDSQSEDDLVNAAFGGADFSSL